MADERSRVMRVESPGPPAGSTELATGMSLYPPVIIRSDLGDRASVVGGIYLSTQAPKSAVMRALGE